MSFHNAFDLDVTIARPFNTYGPRQSARAFIPTIITQIASVQNGYPDGAIGRPTRDLNFVKDTCLGFLLLAANGGTKGGVYNIGSNFEISMADTLEKIMRIMGKTVEVVQDEARPPPEEQRGLPALVRQHQNPGTDRIRSALHARRGPGGDHSLVYGSGALSEI